MSPRPQQRGGDEHQQPTGKPQGTGNGAAQWRVAVKEQVADRDVNDQAHERGDRGALEHVAVGVARPARQLLGTQVRSVAHDTNRPTVARQRMDRRSSQASASLNDTVDRPGAGSALCNALCNALHSARPLIPLFWRGWWGDWIR